MLGGVHGTPSSDAVQNMVKYWCRIILKRKRLSELYDYFIVTRTDHYYLCPINVTSSVNISSKIYIPRCGGWGG